MSIGTRILLSLTVVAVFIVAVFIILLSVFHDIAVLVSVGIIFSAAVFTIDYIWNGFKRKNKK